MNASKQDRPRIQCPHVIHHKHHTLIIPNTQSYNNIFLSFKDKDLNDLFKGTCHKKSKQYI